MQKYYLKNISQRKYNHGKPQQLVLQWQLTLPPAKVQLFSEKKLVQRREKEKEKTNNFFALVSLTPSLLLSSE